MKTLKIKTNEICQSIIDFDVFTSSNVLAVSNNGKYTVYSYTTKILEFIIEGTKKIELTYLDLQRYSNTTSRLQTQIKKALEQMQVNKTNAEILTD